MGGSMKGPRTVEAAKEQLSQILTTAEEQAKFRGTVQSHCKRVKELQWKVRELSVAGTVDAAHAANLLAETIQTADALAGIAKAAVTSEGRLQWVLKSYIATISELEPILAEVGCELMVSV